MSRRYLGGFITANPTIPTVSSASGAWTLSQQNQYANVWPFGGPFNYIEEVFSTYLYTGNGGTQAIGNGIQLGDGYVGGNTGGSGFFDGINEYLSVPTGTALSLTGDFTIECWVYQVSNSGFQGIFGNGEFSVSSQIGFTFSSGAPSLYVGDGTTWAVAINAPTPIPLNAWTHVAATCSGSTFTVWVNGVSVGTATYSGARATPLSTSVIGRLYTNTDGFYMNGYMSNFRIVKGTALYTTTFTPPSSALTAVSGTQILCLQGTTPFVDNSANALTITNNNSTITSSFGPFPFAFVTGKGGLVWVKERGAVRDHMLFRQPYDYLVSNKTQSENALSGSLGVFQYNASGFSVGDNSAGGYNVNGSSLTYVSWTFRKQPKFFDIVTYTGNGTTQNINHSLSSVPGMIFIKRTDISSNWIVLSVALGQRGFLNATSAFTSSAIGEYFGNITSYVPPTSTNFTVGNDPSVNASGGTFVAYIFAHNAGGFGLTGTDNVISCGSYTGNGSTTGPVINLGYEPQCLIIKASSGAAAWHIVDNMRGLSVANNEFIELNTDGAAYSQFNVRPTATGFQLISTNGGFNASGTTYIYMAIRRGPMRTPTLGMSVYMPVTTSGTSANRTISSGFVTDTVIQGNRTGGAGTKFGAWNRLRNTGYNLTTTTAAEVAAGTTLIQANPWDVMNGYKVGTTSSLTNASGSTFINWMFRRAPGFHDVVCYTGTADVGSQNVSHNLGVAPELIIIKSRSAIRAWAVYAAPVGNTQFLALNTTAAATTSVSYWSNTTPTASVFTVGAASDTNLQGATFVAYLFASVAGVSKVGSYTGNGTSQTINCGFTSGSRFVLIKATSTTGDWVVFDSARGIVVGNDPFLQLNAAVTEVTNEDAITTDNTGFVVNQTTESLNANGVTYIYLAIA